jgi:hypothetical protein
MLDDSPRQLRAPLPAAVHNAYTATQLLRSTTKRIPRRHPLQVSPRSCHMHDALLYNSSCTAHAVLQGLGSVLLAAAAASYVHTYNHRDSC